MTPVPIALDELRGRISLAELIGRRISLARRGREFLALCPFHHETTPSFYVVEDKGFYHCFGCGAHGEHVSFVMRYDNLDRAAAVEKLASEVGLDTSKASQKRPDVASHRRHYRLPRSKSGPRCCRCREMRRRYCSQTGEPSS
jgi:DNA primase